jgi:outer membrane protein
MRPGLTISLLALAALGGAQSPPGDALTLDQAVREAEQNAFGVRSARASLTKAQEQTRQAAGLLGPKLTLGANYTRLEGANAGFGQNRQTDSKQASATVSQLIDVTGLSRKAVTAGRLGERVAEAGVEIVLNQLRFDVRRAYFNVLLADALVRVQEDSLKASNERYLKAKARQEAGALAPFDVLRFENEVKKAEQRLVEARGTATTARQALNNTIARPIESDVQAQEVEGEPQVGPGATELVVLAVQSRPEVRQTQASVRLAGTIADTQAAGTAPSLFFNATHTRFIDPAFGDDQGTTAALVFSFPIFDSGSTKAAVRAARQDEERAKLGLEQLVLGIALDVRSAATQLQTAAEAYRVAVDSERLATEALRLAELRYDEGAGIQLDVIQAQADLTAAQAGARTARYGLLTAFANLQRAVGRDDLSAASGSLH